MAECVKLVTQRETFWNYSVGGFLAGFIVGGAASFRSPDIFKTKQFGKTVLLCGIIGSSYGLMNTVFGQSQKAIEKEQITIIQKLKELVKLDK